jgi:hypothetical protein
LDGRGWEEIPNHKHQITNKFQTVKTEMTKTAPPVSVLVIWIFDVGICL